MSIGVFGTARPLTIEDAEAVRRAPFVLATNATTDGNAEVTAGAKRRRITIYGMTADWPRVSQMSVRAGSFLPRQELFAPRPLAVLGVLTFAVGALGSISLIVGGVGILTIMTIAVSERTAEIGLLVALGATRQQIVILFLVEATLLAAIGGTAGLTLGAVLARLLA